MSRAVVTVEPARQDVVLTREFEGAVESMDRLELLRGGNR